MAKTPSKKSRQRSSEKTKAEAVHSAKSPESATATSKKSTLRTKFQVQKSRFQEFRSQRVRLHRSFKRSYREDYLRKTETPGLLHHAILTFQTIFRHWHTFLPFIALMVALYILLVGLMSEDFYVQFQTAIDQSSDALSMGRLGNFAKAGFILISTITSGGLDAGMDEAGMIFMVALFLIMWLVTIFLLRHFRAGEHPRLRDGLYNALAPLLSTFVIFVVIFIEAIPLMLVIITYSAAVMTDFLSTPFYALVYFIFAAVMLLLSGYLLSSSIMALVAVTAPGMYPFQALVAASDLMAGRRTKFILRLLYLIIVVAFIYVITMMPIIVLDLFLKGWFDWLSSWPIVPFFMLTVTCFVFIYATTYIYAYYRWLIEYKEK